MAEPILAAYAASSRDDDFRSGVRSRPLVSLACKWVSTTWKAKLVAFSRRVKSE